MARIIDAFTQFFDGSGTPLVDGWLKFNETGTNNTDKDTFADVNLQKPNANPVPLSAEGRCPNVFGTGSYNVISFADSTISPGTPGQQIEQFDPVGGDLDGAAFADWNAATIYSVGDIVRGSDGLDYRSITSNNQNNNPTSSAANWEEIQLGRVWNANVTYGALDSAYGSDGLLYTSLVGSNLNNDPVSDDGTNWGPSSVADAQIQSVTGSVSASALTLGLLPARLDFRSATLGDGVKSNIAFSTLSLVVPSGATLGTVDTVQSQIVLVAINNAGAVELACVNLSGGNDLSETGLISTVAIDATADLANVFYSAAARTNVTYRVVGISESTQVTAGTWDLAPSLLQGAGGNAFTSLQSLGYGQTYVNETGSRLFAVTYRNTSGRTIGLSIVVSEAAGATWQTVLAVGGETVSVFKVNSEAATASQFTHSAIIRPGGTYELTNPSGTAVIDSWRELK